MTADTRIVDGLDEPVDAAITNARWALLAARQEDIAASLSREDADLRAISEAAVVVVGEVKRGKSSVINALVGAHELCPVGVEVATNTYLVVRDGAPRAQVQLVANDEPFEIDLADVPDYATTVGNPANGRGVQRVELWTPAPILEGISIIDTPGVGGLDSAHGRLVLEVLEMASALLFVLDATAPISQPELNFLREASHRVETIVVVVNKIDAVFAGWRRVVDDDRAVLASEGPRFARCPVLGVSSLLAQRAQEFEEEGESAAASSLRAESGIEDLADLLRGVAEHAPTAVLATRLRRARSALGSAHRNVGELVLAEQASLEFAQDIDDEEERLADLRRDSASWGQKLSSQVALLRIDIIEQLSESRTVAAERIDEAIIRSTNPDLGASVEVVQAEVELLHRETMTALGNGLVDIGLGLLGDLLAMTPIASLAQEMAGRPVALQVTPRQAGRRPTSGLETVQDATTVYMGTNMAHALLAALGVVAQGASAFAGPTALVGLGWAAGLHFLRKKQTKKVEARQWAAKTLIDAQDKIHRNLERGIIEGQDQLATAIRSAIDQRARELEQARAALERALASDAETRRLRADKLRAAQGQLASTGQRIEALLAMAASRLELEPAHP